ncbi:MAG TPA: relaxase/mobilization nuclease RlxS [Allosphingosinicella sp.]|jgi:type IV secretory pathway VirD2 relaxase|uniref:relaxase/mobilization nuclease RlxS n=1 Tax=Allosphingosinicella sp. TaxID=2823234 RepID=UPI002F2A5453
MDEDQFEPRLGRIRSIGSWGARKYLHQVIAATARAGGGLTSGGRRFDGSRIGRGGAVAALLWSRGRSSGARTRRAVVKTRLVRLGGKGVAAARAHLRYVQRDGVSRDGERGALYSAELDAADGKAFLARGAGDRHQFRLIVSAEDGVEYDDLRPLARRFMAQMQEDLGTKLDWVAADHRDTAHPHTHIILRGKDDRGENLVIAPSYIQRGMRERLAELVTLDLGPRTELDVQRALRRDVSVERFTGLDRGLQRDADEERIVSASRGDPLQQALRAGRLKKLEALGLAEPLVAGRWRLAEGLEERLRRLGERGDIVRTMQRELSARRIERGVAELVPDAAAMAGPLVGRVAGRGLSDEMRDRQYLLVDGLDGRVHYVDLGRGDAVEPLPDGAIVRVVPVTPEARAADRVVAEVAGAHGGLYSVERHLLYDQTASIAFAEAHVRRLEAIRRATGGADRRGDGTWIIAKDHVARAEAYEARASRERPVRVELLSPLPVERLLGADGATWLDRELMSGSPEPVRDAGFGREVKSALATRRQWLIEQELAREEQGALVTNGRLLATLRRRDLAGAAAQLQSELGLGWRDVGEEGTAQGKLVRRMDLASGRFALLSDSLEFSLVPWRPEMEQRIGRELSVRMRGGGISWTIGRERSGPQIGM